jgi:hypothetical protein
LDAALRVEGDADVFYVTVVLLLDGDSLGLLEGVEFCVVLDSVTNSGDTFHKYVVSFCITGK